MTSSVIACSAIASAHAVPVVVNGSFNSTQYARSTEFGPSFGGQGVDGWTSSAGPGPSGGFNTFWRPSDIASGYSAANRFGDTNDKLPTLVTPSPDGGSFVALDGDSDYRGYLYQTITGLTAGTKYKVSFYWAGAQLLNRTGDTTDSLSVSLGSAPGVGETYVTAPVSVTTHGFSGWMLVTDTFTAASATAVLAFLSIGTPNGLPPMALLDGVSIAPASVGIASIPEPVGLAVVGLALVGLCIARPRPSDRGDPA